MRPFDHAALSLRSQTGRGIEPGKPARARSLGEQDRARIVVAARIWRSERGPWSSGCLAHRIRSGGPGGNESILRPEAGWRTPAVQILDRIGALTPRAQTQVFSK
jgi:hypothetical protein